MNIGRCFLVYCQISVFVYFLDSGITLVFQMKMTLKFPFPLYTWNDLSYPQGRDDECFGISMNLWRVHVWYKIPEGLLSLRYTHNKTTSTIRLDSSICWQLKLLPTFNAFYWEKNYETDSNIIYRGIRDSSVLHGE